MHTSTIQILKVEVQQSKKLNPDTGKPYESTIARTALLDDDGQLQTVGRLRVPRDLVDQAKVGTFRASFALQVPDFGEFKGEVISVLTGLVPLPVNRVAPAAAPVAASKP
ncbi:hypothetical protein [Paracidovorax wautersii]|uniref:hypothetical protein n=1 Tax=Paracidovorax wautersii TaxID=1177982 RepID=UPI0031E360A1